MGNGTSRPYISLAETFTQHLVLSMHCAPGMVPGWAAGGWYANLRAVPLAAPPMGHCLLHIDQPAEHLHLSNSVKRQLPTSCRYLRWPSSVHFCNATAQQTGNVCTPCGMQRAPRLATNIVVKAQRGKRMPTHARTPSHKCRPTDICMCRVAESACSTQGSAATKHIGSLTLHTSRVISWLGKRASCICATTPSAHMSWVGCTTTACSPSSAASATSVGEHDSVQLGQPVLPASTQHQPGGAGSA